MLATRAARIRRDAGKRGKRDVCVCVCVFTIFPCTQFHFALTGPDLQDLQDLQCDSEGQLCLFMLIDPAW